jgi:hypothetical protein
LNLKLSGCMWRSLYLYTVMVTNSGDTSSLRSYKDATRKGAIIIQVGDQIYYSKMLELFLLQGHHGVLQ